MLLSQNTVTVVICAYTEKRWDDLISAVKSVRAQSLPPKEMIIVIDNNPSLFIRASGAFTDITVIENGERRGLSGARNSAIKIASGQIIAFMDEDASADSDWLERLTVHYTDENVMAVGGAIIPNWLEVKPRWFPDEFLWVVGCTYIGMPVSAAPVRNLIGCNMSFRASVFHHVGGFRNDIGRVGTRPVGCEETELCIRAQQQLPEQRLIYTPSAIVHHRVPALRSNLRYFISRCYSEGISKALVSRYVGTQNSLASERTYAIKTLPLGVFRNLVNVITGADKYGFGKALTLILGLMITGIGYITGAITLMINPITIPAIDTERSTDLPDPSITQ